MRMFKIFILPLFLAVSGGMPRVLAQQNAYESPAGTKFLLYTPPGYFSTTSTFPLLLSLHSKGETSNDIAELTSKNPEQMPCRLIYLNKWPQDLPFIVLTPQLKPDPNNPEIQWSAGYIEEVVQYVLKNYRVDLTRIYVTGISRGGTGAWTYASAYPEKVAALLPMSGRSDLTQACPIKDIPLWAFHGDGDGTAPPKYSIDMVNAIKSCQPSGMYKPRLTLLHARNHDGWNEVYNGTNGYRVYDWLLSFRKNDNSNKGPYVNAGRDLKIQLRGNGLHIAGDYFDWDGDIQSVTWKQTAGTPLTLHDTGSQLLKISGLQKGIFEFQLTVIDNDAAQSSDKVIIEITDATVIPVVTGMVLMDGKSNLEIGNLSEEQVINKATLGLTEINVRAIVSDGTQSVRFTVNTDGNTRTVNAPGPYLIKPASTWQEWKVGNGDYLICATPYTQPNATGTRGVSQCYKITFTDVAPPSCPGAGKIQQELWTNISGTSVSSIPLGTKANYNKDLTSFQTGNYWSDNYGSRIRGYVCAPASGAYTFWISGDDRGELWLSTDANPANKKLIATLSASTGVKEWTKYPSQKSVAINLVANQRYYVEALHKEGTGADHVAVGWQLPGGVLERPIPGNRLIPFQQGTTAPPVVEITNPGQGQKFSAPALINITANASATGGTITKVEFYNGTAKLGEDLSAPYSFSWKDVAAGNYVITTKATDSNGATATHKVDIAVSNASSACSGTGTIKRELWNGVSGADVAAIPVNAPPSSINYLTIFEELSNVGDNFGTRITGYVCAPQTGSYVFWVSSNDHSQLSLSTDESPLNKKTIAYVSGYTNVREWAKYTTQKSLPIHLVAGQRYYVEALHKEGVGSDHMAVGWQLPDGILERPIVGSRLSPAGQTTSGAGQNSSLIMAEGETGTGAADEYFQIFPNPMATGNGTITISGFADRGETWNTNIEIMTVTGEVIYSTDITCPQDCNVTVGRHLSSGVYLMIVNRNGKRFSKRLLVK